MRVTLASPGLRWFLLVVMSVVLLEIGSWLTLGILRAIGQLPQVSSTTLNDEQRQSLRSFASAQTSYYDYSPSLGWTIKSDGQAGLYRANRDGLRADRDYRRDPCPGVVRIAAFGDSFTHGSEVANEDAWTSRLEHHRDSLEVLNFGVDAYGLDQSYLRYKELGTDFGAHIVLIGFMSENLHRSVNTFRPFYLPSTGSPLPKPRFVLAGDSLVLLPNSIRDRSMLRSLASGSEATWQLVAEHDYYYQTRKEYRRPRYLATHRLVSAALWRLRQPLTPGVSGDIYDRDSEAYRTTYRILVLFYGDVIRNGSVPIVLLFPNKQDVRNSLSGGRMVYQPLKDDLSAAAFRFFDLAEALSDHAAVVGVDALFETTHYSALGNRIAAAAIAEYLTGITPGGLRPVTIPEPAGS